MIDIHTHILHGLDDGAKTVEESVLMAMQAVAQGITHVVATPHHMNRRFETDGQDVRDRVAQLNVILQQKKISLQVGAGQEIRMYPELLHDLDRQEILTLADSAYILLEFPALRCPDGIFDLMHELQVRGYVPVIAHPERNAELLDNLALVRELVEHGALLQITTHSLLGLFGRKMQAFAMKLCKDRLVHFISTDAHDTRVRGNNLGKVYTMLEAKLGKAICDYWNSNAAAVFENHPITGCSPKVAHQGLKKYFLPF